MDITSERNIQGTDSSLQDGDHTDGCFITLFAEQLTRPFEVLVYFLCKGFNVKFEWQHLKHLSMQIFLQIDYSKSLGKLSFGILFAFPQEL